MSEEMKKTPVVRAENAPVVKESQLPAEKKAAEVPVVVEAKEEAHVDSPEADVEIHIIDNRDEEAESLIRWAAGRAGVIVAAPVLGTVALVANEVYMIAKVAKVYDVEVNQTAILSFIGSLGGTVIGTTLATLIPISIMQIPIGVTVTYGVGKAAQCWIKDGMPDDTRPYRAVFEEEKAAASEEKELEDNPKKDEPLGDEKKDFTKELKKNWEEIYPEKAHAKMNELADQLSESVTVLGDKFLSALKKVGVTDEQIEKAKYTALGASEIAQETAEKAAKDLQAIARIKSREFKKNAAKKAEVVKAQAKDQMEVLQQKREEMKRQSEVQSQQMKLKSEKLKAQARVQMQEAKIQANKLKVQAEEFREQAEEQAETAKASAQEFSEKVKTQAAEYKEAAQAKAAEAKESFKQTASEYKAKIEERAAQKQAEAKKEGNPGENPGTSEEAPKADPPADPKE